MCRRKEAHQSSYANDALRSSAHPMALKKSKFCLGFLSEKDYILFGNNMIGSLPSQAF